MAAKIAYHERRYGFQFGAATVTRRVAEERWGWVILDVETPKQSIRIYVTKTGNIRIYDDMGEWARPMQEKAIDENGD